MDAEAPAKYDYIDTHDALENACRELTGARRIAVDLEADSLYHFQEKVCLLQLAANGSNFVVDPLAVPDLSSLKPLFADENIQKIFHGADYDVRSLYRDFGITIRNLFDTELASRFLGISGTGLEAVVNEHLGICLDKKYQKKDWSKRPLPREMIDYAAGDVMYLLPISTNLIAELKRKKRLEWVLEECKHLSAVRPADNNHLPLFTRIKGAGRLSQRALAALESILHLRQEIARKKDKPMFKVFSNRTALALAIACPISQHALKDADILSRGQLQMYGKRIVSCLKAAMKIPENELPVYPKNKSPRPPADVAPRIKALQQWRNDKGEALCMDPGLICNRSLAASIATLCPENRDALEQIKEMKQWQKAAFGDEIISTLKAVNSKR